MDGEFARSCLRDCAAQLCNRHRRHDQDLAIRRLRPYNANGFDGSLLRRRRDAYTYAYSKSNSYCNASSYAYSYSNWDTHSTSYADTNSKWDTHSNSASSYADTNSKRDPHTNSASHADTYSKWNPHSDPGSNRAASTESGA